MTIDPRTPVLIGQGQALDRNTTPGEALDPVGLMAKAVRSAIVDSGGTMPHHVDSVRVVRLLSWKYANPAYSLARACGLDAREYATTPHGGNMPQTLVNVSASQIASGERDIVILAGGECARTRSMVTDTQLLGWPTPVDASTPGNASASHDASIPMDIPEPTHIVDDLALLNEEEQRLGIVLPIQVYPLFESALRADAQRGIDAHEQRVARLWSRLSAVAADNEFAWSRNALSATDILRVSPTNRMIGLPYRKVMNSNNQVNMAAAIIMCSVERAQAMGVPRDRWVFPHAGADCHEHQYISQRWSFARTPAVALGGRLALELAGTSLDDVAFIDLYSCFPSAVQLGAASLGVDLERDLTLTGGLSFAGGPWNNYVMHAIATAMMRLRAAPRERAFIWANGGYATKHSFGVYAMQPPTAGFRHGSPQDEVDALPRRELAIGRDAAGNATIDAYTVMHDREGKPERLIASAIRDDARRVWVTSNNAAVAAGFVHGEHVGDRVVLRESGVLTD